MNLVHYLLPTGRAFAVARLAILEHLPHKL